MSFFKPQFMQPWIDAYKKGGIKELLSQHGWKVIICFFLFSCSSSEDESLSNENIVLAEVKN